MSGGPQTVVVMGVSGAGKSAVGSRLARRLGAVFEDGDDFHPAANKAKMSAGIPLTDADRLPWYATLRRRILEGRRMGERLVLACSALRQAHRDVLRDGDGGDELVFVHLRGSRELIAARLAGRRGHFMPASLLESQLATLEEPADAIAVEVSGDPAEIVERIVEELCRLRVAGADGTGNSGHG